MKLLTTLTLMTLSFSSLTAEVDLKKSQFTWTATKVSGEHTGNVYLKNANLKLKSNGSINSGNFEINMNTISVTDLSGQWADKFLGHIKSKDFFEVTKYPSAKLLVTQDNGKQLSGKLTIKGKTQPVSIDYKKVGKTFSGKLTFDRTKFDMIYGSGNFFKNLGDKMIHNDVKLDFKVVLK